MSLLLDAGALIAFDRGSRVVQAFLERAARGGEPVRTTAGVVAQVWRRPSVQSRVAPAAGGRGGAARELGRAAHGNPARGREARRCRRRVAHRPGARRRRDPHERPWRSRRPRLRGGQDSHHHARLTARRRAGSSKASRRVARAAPAAPSEGSVRSPKRACQRATVYLWSPSRAERYATIARCVDRSSSSRSRSRRSQAWRGAARSASRPRPRRGSARSAARRGA